LPASDETAVVRVLAYADSSVYGGAEAVFCHVAADLADRGRLDVTAAAPESNARLAQALERATARPAIPVPAQPLRLSALHLTRRRRAVAGALEGRRWDVLLVNLPSTEYGATPLLLDVAPAAVGLLHIHHSLASLGFRLGRVRDRIARGVVQRADAVAVLSERARSEVEAWAPRSRVCVVPLPRPVVAARERVGARRALGLPDATVVGIAGRISIRQKGHDLLVGAAAALPVDVHFAVAGEGRDEPALRRLVERHGLTGRFHLLGRVEPVGTFLSAVDVLAIPSRFEGLPLVALEAIAHGLPGAAAAVDGLVDVWPREWLVAPNDAEALAAGLERVLGTAEPALADAIDEARRRVALRTTEDLGPAYENLILELNRSVARRGGD
jgi:glycosyltransferase involved in cell wall biosynthesis